MPNHVVNFVSFKGDDAQIKQMLSEVQNDEFGPGSISFQKLIPMPTELNIECGTRTDAGIKAYRDFLTALASEDAYLHSHPDIDRETFELGKKAHQNIEKYGARDWYDWHIDHWDTKWDAYGYREGTDYSAARELRFLTAWSAPHQVLQKLSERYPSLEITHQWADEDIGFNCGTAVYRAGDQTALEVMQNDDFANRFWDEFDNANRHASM